MCNFTRAEEDLLILSVVRQRSYRRSCACRSRCNSARFFKSNFRSFLFSHFQPFLEGVGSVAWGMPCNVCMEDEGTIRC